MSAKPCRCMKAGPDGMGLVCWSCLERMLYAKARREEWEGSGISPPTLPIRSALEAFDRWNDGDPGKAYGAVMLYGARYVRLEELTRAVLADAGIFPERWREYTAVVERAYRVWRRADCYPATDYLDRLEGAA